MNNYSFKIKLYSVHDYCMAYTCKEDWTLIAKACICFDKSLWKEAKHDLKKYDSKFNTKPTAADDAKSGVNTLLNLQR